MDGWFSAAIITRYGAEIGRERCAAWEKPYAPSRATKALSTKGK